MKYVKLTQAVGVRSVGEVLHVDNASAASLVEVRKVGEYVSGRDAAEALRSAPARGTMSATQIVDADEPGATTLDAPTPADVALTESPSTPGEQIVDGRQSQPSREELESMTKAQLLVFAGDRPDADKMTKAELVDALAPKQQS